MLLDCGNSIGFEHSFVCDEWSFEMATIESFEELDSWKEARELARVIYKQTSKREFSRDFALKDQLRRAIISVISNLAEGFERESNLDKLRFYGFAKASAGEVRAQCYIALDQGYLATPDFAQMKLSVIKVSNLIAGMMRYLKSKQVDEQTSLPRPSSIGQKRLPSKNVQHSTFNIQHSTKSS